uniref:TRAF-type zinc finger domain-containing protein 1 n=2 Tax=Xenopus tropicalis TaxID=8364 RepID=A0A6I8RL73_XENTR
MWYHKGKGGGGRLGSKLKRDIPLSNFTIHEIHCKRNLSVCDVCKEPVPTADMEEHLATEHMPVTCKCKMTMEKAFLEEHKLSACPLRLVKCQFCELEVAFNALADHEDYCGARTERCEKCGRSVMIKDLNDHPDVCGKESVPKKPLLNSGAWFDAIEKDNLHAILPSRFYRNPMFTPSLQNLHRGAGQDKAVKQTNLTRNIPARGQEQVSSRRDVLSSSINQGPSGFSSIRSQRLQNEIGSSVDPDTDLSANVNSWRAFDSKDKVAKYRDWQMESNLFSGDKCVEADSPSAQTDNQILLPCEFCEKLFPEEDLILHQSGCNPRVFASFCDRRPSPTHFVDFHRDQYVRPVSPPPSVHIPNSILIPCEFCGVQLEEEDLVLHESGCNPGAFSSFLDQNSPSTRLLDLEQKLLSNRTEQTHDRNIRPVSPPPPVHKSSNILIPCEFCGVQMEGDVLFHHQDQCDMCPNFEDVPVLQNTRECNDLQDRLMASQSDDLFHQGRTTASYTKTTGTGRPTHPGPMTLPERVPFEPPFIPMVPRTSFVTHQFNVDERKRNIEENSLHRNRYDSMYSTRLHGGLNPRNVSQLTGIASNNCTSRNKAKKALPYLSKES